MQTSKKQFKQPYYFTSKACEEEIERLEKRL